MSATPGTSPAPLPRPTSAPTARPHRGVVIALVVTAVIALVAAGVGVAVAFDQRVSAAAWQERAAELRVQRDDALDRADTLSTGIEEATTAATRSERDVVELEERVRELADEKAQAEDTATTVQVERDVLAEVSSEVGAATGALDDCVDELFDLHEASVAAFNLAVAGGEVDVAALNARADDVARSCAQARALNDRARGALDQLVPS